MNQYDKVRDQHTCPLCWGSKDKGTLLCWPCHHKENPANNGCYANPVLRQIAAFEDLLGGPNG